VPTESIFPASGWSPGMRRVSNRAGTSVRLAEPQHTGHLQNGKATEWRYGTRGSLSKAIRHGR